MRVAGLFLFLLLGFASAPVRAADLPFADSIWADTEGGIGCNRAEQVFIYAGNAEHRVSIGFPNAGVAPGDSADQFTSSKAGKNGYYEVTGQYGSYKLKVLPNGRLERREWSYYANGSEELVDVRQKCAFSQLSPALQKLVAQYVPSAAAAAAPTAAPVAPAAVATGPWSVTADSMAMYKGTGNVQAILLSCNQDGTANVVMQLKPAFKQKSLSVNFASPMSGGYTEAIAYSPEHKLWLGRLHSPSIDKFIHDESLSVELPGMRGEQISLAGSSKAIKAAMQSCLYGPSGTPGTAVAPFGLASGYYVADGNLCTDPASIYFYDGKRFGMLNGNAPDPQFPNDPRGELWPIGKPKKVGKVWKMSDGSTVEPTSATRFVFTFEEGVAVRWCPAEQIPAYARVQ